MFPSSGCVNAVYVDDEVILTWKILKLCKNVREILAQMAAILRNAGANRIHYMTYKPTRRLSLEQPPWVPENITSYRTLHRFDLNYLSALDDWLTVHHSVTLVDLQLDALNSYLFTYNTFIKILYMFRALPCSSSGGLRRNCIYAASGIVTHCRWLSCAPVKKELLLMLI